MVSSGVFMDSSSKRCPSRPPPLPTDPQTVNAWFREIGEPIVLFGESLVDRRTRLGVEITRRGGLDSLPRLKSSLEPGQEKRDRVAGKDATGKRSGGEKIVELRKRIIDYWSMSRHPAIPDYGSPVPQCGIELTGANVAGSRPSTDICKYLDYLAVLDRNGTVSLLNSDLDSVYSVELETACSLSAHGHLLLGAGMDGSTRLYNHSTREVILFGSACQGRRLYQCAWHPSGLYFASCGADAVWRFWDVEERVPLFEHSGHHPELGIRGISVSKHGGALVFTGGGDGVVRVWDTRIGRCIVTGSAHVQSITCVDSMDCMFITGGLDNKIVGWDLRQADQPLYSLPAHTSAITGLKYGTPTTFASCSLDNTVRLWHISGRSISSTLVNEPAKPTGLCAVGHEIFTCGFDKTVRQFSIK